MKLIVKKRPLQTTFILVGIIVLGVSLFCLLAWWEARERAAGTDADPYSDYGRRVVSYQGESYALRDGLETILFIGVDQYRAETKPDSYNNTQQADFLLLSVLDHKNKTNTVLHLNRDTMADIPVLGVRGEKAGSIKGQLALAHTYGSGGRDSSRNTVEAVSNLLYGISIDHYLAVTMDAVALVNDLSGGVQVEMREDFSAIDPAMKKGAVVTLKGEQALSYVRVRKGLDDSTNLGRMERQRQYLDALRGRLRASTEGDDSFLLHAVSSLSRYMESDCTVEQLSRLFQETQTYQHGEIVSLEGRSVQGKEFMEFYADEDALRLRVIHCFYEPYTQGDQS
ncbi:MAG: LCP family protein [Oscillospiraceae bacterium]|jgi:LCP family protein required for cell wall assembly